jgi:hypothetical protein
VKPGDLPACAQARLSASTQDPNWDQVDLDIAAAFADGVKSSDVSALVAEVEGAALASGEAADHARRQALDPTRTANAVAEARRQMEDAAFRRERLQTAVTRLKERLREIKGLEENQRRQIIYDTAKAERDLLARELKAHYPTIEAQLGELIAKIEMNDRQIEYINSLALPTGAERLRSAELVASEVEAWRINQQEVVRITHELVLPRFENDPHRPYAWPRWR